MLLGTMLGAALMSHSNVMNNCEAKDEGVKYPVYRRDDVSKHRTPEQRIWVAYRDGVYDITDFVKVHPGGSEKILLGAGSNLEPFFKFYPFHQKENVQQLLAKYKIGELHPDDRLKEEPLPAVDEKEEK